MVEFDFHLFVVFHQVLEEIVDDIIELMVVQNVLNQHIQFLIDLH